MTFVIKLTHVVQNCITITINLKLGTRNALNTETLFSIVSNERPIAFAVSNGSPKQQNTKQKGPEDEIQEKTQRPQHYHAEDLPNLIEKKTAQIGISMHVLPSPYPENF